MDAAKGHARALDRHRAPAGELDSFTLRLAARGDARASRALLRCYQARVYALISRVLRGRERSVVDDLAQEVFLRTFKVLPSFDPDGPAKLSTWIYRVATRLCIDEMRRRRPSLVGEELELLAHEVDRGPEEATRRARLRRALLRALDELSAEQRVAFVLFEFHGQGYADIADTLELPIGTVRSRISRARRTLREALTQEGREFIGGAQVCAETKETKR